MAIASNAIEMRSPAVSSMSNSRPDGRGTICLASSIRSSVVSPIADTTTTTSSPPRLVATMRSAARRIRSAFATAEPPYFCTTSPTVRPFPTSWRNLQDTGRGTMPLPRRVGARRDLSLVSVRQAWSGRGGECRFENVEAFGEQIVADDQGRQESQHVAERPIRERDQPLLMARGRERRGERRIRGERATGLDQLERQHRPASADVADDVV